MVEQKIREVKLTDRDLLNDLFLQELEYHKKLLPDIFNVPDTLINDSWLDSVIKSQNEFLVVTEKEGNIVGAIYYKIRTNPDDIILKERRFGYIQEMIVSETERRQGIGRGLMDRAIEDLKNRGIGEIELNIWEDNEPGMKFYENYGFRTVQRRMRIDRL
jgi:ribosomal protein S18 acetylase RimI-like enzyme